MAKNRGKKYQDALKKVDTKKAYAVNDAVQLVKDIDFANFDSSIEVAFNLNVDTKQADQQLRGAVVLPNGTGKDQTVIVFAEGDNAKAAEEAGADFVGSDDLVEKIQDGWLDFDVAIATPNMMPKVGRLGRVLGPKGLMPNPKTGTVTMDVAKAVSDAKAGQVTYRPARSGGRQRPFRGRAGRRAGHLQRPLRRGARQRPGQQRAAASKHGRRCRPRLPLRLRHGAGPARAGDPRRPGRMRGSTAHRP